MTSNRREFISRMSTSVAALAVSPAILGRGPRVLDHALASTAAADPRDLAGDEPFWREIRRAFDVPSGIVNLDHGNINPAPRAVIEDLVRHARSSQRFPAREIYDLFADVTERVVQPGLARILGVPVDEIVLMRNATDALDTVLLGFPLKPGDEIVCSTHDYFAMLDALEQRRAREGVVLRMIHPPVPAPSMDALAALYQEAITAQTRLVLVTHPSNLTGQLYPVRRIADLAHRVGAELVVDGAQSMALVDYTIPDLGCDYFGASLHKWLSAPVGAGVLWMKKDRAAKIWPLVPPPASVTGLKRFTWSGTYPEFVAAAAVPAIAFHERMGTARKAARMRYLTSYWRERVERLPRIKFYSTNAAESSCGIVTFEIEGLTADALRDQLWERGRIFVQRMFSSRAPEIRGVRISPNVYTTPGELDKFVATVEHIVRTGAQR